jgi:hypothetical protein
VRCPLVLVSIVTFLLITTNAKSQLRAALSANESACIDRSALIDHVDAYLGRLALEPPYDVQVVLRVVETPRGLDATLTMSSMDGHVRGRRVLRGTRGTCAALEREIALVLALLLETERHEIELQMPPMPEPVNRSESGPAEHGSDRSESSALVLRAHLLGLGTFGLLPEVAGGGRAGLSIDATNAPHVIVFVEGHGTMMSGVGPGVDAGLGLAGALLCPELVKGGDVHLDLCVGASAGVLVISPRGLDASVELVRAFVDLRVAGALEWTFTPSSLALRLELGAQLPMTRDRFYYETGGDVRVLHRVSDLVPYAAIGLSFGGE